MTFGGLETESQSPVLHSDLLRTLNWITCVPCPWQVRVKVKRTEIVVNSEEYSREHGIPRSLGCHVSQVIEKIVERDERREYDQFSAGDLENLRKVGFMFERAMSAHARTVMIDGLDSYAEDRPDLQPLLFPGEMFWCYSCDTVMPGADIAARHCTRYKHKGIFFTPDAAITDPFSVMEWKYTHLSSRRTGDDHIDGIPKWKYQTMWYCFGLDTPRAVIEATFARGDYADFKPKVQTFQFEVEYTSRELHQNKTMIISNARAEGLL